MDTNHSNISDLYEDVWKKNLYNGFSQDTEGAQSTPFLETFISLVHQAKKPMPRIAEFGAGSGDHALRLAREGIQVTAVESSSTAVDLIKKKNAQQQGSVQVVQTSLFDFIRKSEPESQDGVYANAVFHFLSQKEREKIYEDLWKLLSPTGCLGISFKAEGDSLQKRGHVVEETAAGAIVEGSDGIRRLFVKDLKPLCQEMAQKGFEIVTTLQWQIANYNIVGEVGFFAGILARKPADLS
jgi:trans-aconitate methyltransferase